MMARCGKCGQTMEAGARFCSACGQPLTPPTPTTASVAPAQPSNTKKWLLIGLGVLALIAVAFVLGVQSGFFAKAQVKPEEAPSILQAEAPPEAPSIL
ncbi:MAG: zinc-ribbon domain-containing protein, partial [Fimbriimonadales bacterium]